MSNTSVVQNEHILIIRPTLLIPFTTRFSDSGVNYFFPSTALKTVIDFCDSPEFKNVCPNLSPGVFNGNHPQHDRLYALEKGANTCNSESPVCVVSIYFVRREDETADKDKCAEITFVDTPAALLLMKKLFRNGTFIESR